MSFTDKVVEQIGMPALTEEMIACDLLLAAKTGVRTYAIAITETASPQVREVLQKQLNQEIEMHARIAQFMISNNMYQAYNVNELLQHDMQKAEMAMNLPSPS